MIYVRDKGRMCNNILQYGHLYAWGRKHGRRTLSMRFAYKYPYFHICDTPGHNFFRYLIGKLGAQTGLFPVVAFHEKNEDTADRENILFRSRNAVAEGWEARFYSEFLEYFEEIKSLFAFKKEVCDSAIRTLEAGEIPGSLKLGIHIRRGDYSRWQEGRYFFSDDQYIEIIKKIISSLPEGRDVSVYICGNDPTLDEKKYLDALSELGDRRKIKVSFPKGNPGEDLCLLSECDLLAGPPSTFTLVASMYKEIPLYWIKDADKEVIEEKDFGRFRKLFKEII